VAAFAAEPSIARNALPSRIGDCARTRISWIGHRLEDGATHQPMTDSGSAVRFANRLYQVSYEEVAEVHHSRRGDPVLICLVSLPRDCPRGDDRGKVYTTTDLRTVESWTLPDSEHACGGA
jgi:hypothetical protein